MQIKIYEDNFKKRNDPNAHKELFAALKRVLIIDADENVENKLLLYDGCKGLVVEDGNQFILTLDQYRSSYAISEYLLTVEESYKDCTGDKNINLLYEEID